MNDKKSPIHLIFTVIYFVLAIITLVPAASVSKVSPLGYKALCSFSPYSTILLVLGAVLHIYLDRKSAAKI